MSNFGHFRLYGHPYRFDLFDVNITVNESAISWLVVLRELEETRPY